MRPAESRLDAVASGPVVTLGECMASFVARERGSMAEPTDFLRTVAGAEANVAVGLARLGLQSVYIGRVGADALGIHISRKLRGEGVDVHHLAVDPDATTGVMIRELRDVGPSEVIYWRSGSAGSRLAPSDIESAGTVIGKAAWLHVTGITPALSPGAAAALDAALDGAPDAKTSLDLNLRRRLWSELDARAALAPLLARCDVVLGGLDELAVVGGLADTLEAASLADHEATIDSILQLGAKTVVLKLGASGARQRSADDGVAASLVSPAHPVDRVVDPVGAGDAFTAGYIATVLGNGSAADALAAGNACGAAVVASLGDQAGLPTRAELDRLLIGGGRDTLR